MRKFILSMFLIISICSPSIHAEIYKVIDENGNVSFSDMPQENSESVQINIPEPEVVPQQKKSSASTQKAEAIHQKNVAILKKDLSKIDKAIASAKITLEKMNQEKTRCLGVRRVGIKNIEPCNKLQGNKKTACIASQPINYKISTPENCTPKKLKETQQFLDKAYKERQKIQLDLQKVDSQ